MNHDRPATTCGHPGADRLAFVREPTCSQGAHYECDTCAGARHQAFETGLGRRGYHLVGNMEGGPGA